MVVVTLQRKKCIGCNYCVELAPMHFQMARNDGKSVLLHATEKKGFHTLNLSTTLYTTLAKKPKKHAP